MEKLPIYLAYALGPLREGESHLVTDDGYRNVLRGGQDSILYPASCMKNLPHRIFNIAAGYVWGKTMHYLSDNRLMKLEEISCPICRKNALDLLN